jgi:hypothetical protein
MVNIQFPPTYYFHIYAITEIANKTIVFIDNELLLAVTATALYLLLFYLQLRPPEQIVLLSQNLKGKLQAIRQSHGEFAYNQLYLENSANIMLHRTCPDGIHYSFDQRYLMHSKHSSKGMSLFSLDNFKICIKKAQLKKCWAQMHNYKQLNPSWVRLSSTCLLSISFSQYGKAYPFPHIPTGF